VEIVVLIDIEDTDFISMVMLSLKVRANRGCIATITNLWESSLAGLAQ